MASVMKEFEHLKIHLEELNKATNSFSSKVIGSGGFGKVYEGEVSHSRGRSMAAIKRLNREFGQGDPEFLREIVMLSRYTHKNLISLLGYCDEDDEKILVYEHASNGSLDRHLSSTSLTWAKRLKICLEVARGLAYLHDHKGTQQRILHRDIKSANILLDENWNVKLADMGLSKIGPANQQHSVLFTNVVGTPGYCDPQYIITYAFTKESDIYSFGVVLFEVLCGRLCVDVTNGHLEILVPMWKQCYIDKKLDQIIFTGLTPPMDLTLRIFSEVAFRCLHESREKRPTMSLIMGRLELALEYQESHEKQVYLNRLLSEGKELFLGEKVSSVRESGSDDRRVTSMSNGELMAPNGSSTLSTEKLRKRLLEEGVSEAAIQDSETIMSTEFEAMQNQLFMLKQKHALLIDTLRMLELESVSLHNVYDDDDDDDVEEKNNVIGV